jgi:hypothetical protein
LQAFGGIDQTPLSLPIGPLVARDQVVRGHITGRPVDVQD